MKKDVLKLELVIWIFFLFKLDLTITIVWFLSFAFMVLVKQLRQTSDPNSGLISSLGFTFIYNFDYKEHLPHCSSTFYLTCFST